MDRMNGVGGAATLFQTSASECELKGNGKMTAKRLREILERQGYRCALTGIELTPETANVDHIVPLSRGGPHAPSNAQVILDYVNKAKGTMTNEEFIEMCCAVAAFASDYPT